MQILKKLLVIIWLAAVLIIIGWLNHSARFFFKTTSNKSSNFAVASAPVVQKDVKVNINASGKVQPTTTIVVKSQIDGIILNSFFQEGQMVQQGQLLFEIDPCPLQAVYDQATANLVKSQAELQNSKLKLQKYEKLHQNNFVSDQDYEQVLANFKSSEAMSKAADAALNAAKLQLGFTKIYSPITGIVGQILVHPGNVIKTAAGLSLVNINQINPINVLFTIPEEYLSELLKNLNNLDNLAIKILGIDNVGKLIFVDNQVNSLNGTITLKAEFCNCNFALWPGKFVNIELTIKTLLNALVVPARAVQSGQQGTYVYIAENPKKHKHNYFAKVKKVLVKTGSFLADEITIIEGLQAGQLVITEGHAHLMDKDIVEIHEN